MSGTGGEGTSTEYGLFSSSKLNTLFDSNGNSSANEGNLLEENVKGKATGDDAPSFMDDSGYDVDSIFSGSFLFFNLSDITIAKGSFNP